MSLRPLYVFRCDEHGKVELRMTMTARDGDVPCPECGIPMHKIISAPAGIMFLGSGFYTTDSVAKPNVGRNVNNQNRHSKG